MIPLRLAARRRGLRPLPMPPYPSFVRLLPAALAVALAAACLPLAGCNFVVLRPGHTAFVFGELNTSVDRAFPAVGSAVVAACAELGWTGSARRESLVDLVFTRRTDLHRPVVIKVEQTGRASARVRIRVGSRGDETVSRRLLERIAAHLPAPPSADLASR